MEPDRLKSELLARAPISIKESDDLAKLRNLQDGAAAVGAVTDLQSMGDGENVFVLVNGTPRGPVPHAYVEDRVRSGAWPSSISVAVVGSSDWRPFLVPATPATEIDQQATVAFNTLSPAMATAKAAPAPAPEMRMSAAAPAPSRPASGPPWRRENCCLRAASFTQDSGVDSPRICSTRSSSRLPFLILFGLLAYMSFKAALSGESPGATMFLLYVVVYIGAIVGSWLYFAKFESGVNQATPGKRIMGIKVTSTSGDRIGFGRATGRFFGKIVSGMSRWTSAGCSPAGPHASRPCTT